MLILLAEELDTSVSGLLGETVPEPSLNEMNLENISKKLENINYQFAKRKVMRIRIIRYLLILLCILIVIIFIYA